LSEQAKLEITEAEWEVMDSVWEGGPQTPAEIIARVQPIRERSHRTIRTLLNRLVDKGAVRIEEASGKRLYVAAVSKDACIRAAAKSFRERFFAGSVGSLLMHFVEHESLSAEELAELRAKLDEVSKPSTNCKQTTSPNQPNKPSKRRKL
jgi:BlaI family penicillinase repressor